MKKIIITLCIAVGIISMSSCKEKEPISNPTLYNNWRLDSMSHISGRGVVTKEDFDTTNWFEGAYIVLTFNDKFKVTAQYNGIGGIGTYELLNNNNEMKVKGFHRGDFGGFESPWFNAFVNNINGTEKYSIIGTKLSIFHDGNTRQLHFTKL